MKPGRAALVACVGAFVSALSTSLVAVAAPVIARDLGATQAQVGWVLTAYLLTVSGLLATMGRLADVFGRRRVVLIGFALFALASAACGLAPTLGLLVTARVVQGAAASTLMATGPAIITGAFPPERRGRALGLQLAVTYAGLTLGPTLGGALTQAIGWSAVFFAVATASAIGTALALWLLEPDHAPDAARAAPPPLDVVGAVLLAIALAALLLGLRRDAAILLPLSLVAVVLLARQESKHPAPILPPALLRTPAFVVGVAASLTLYVVTFVLAYLLPFHLQRGRGMDPAHAGALMTAQPLTMALVAPVSGWLADRFGPRGPQAAGMLSIAGGVALVSRTADGSDLSIVLSLAVVGLGAGLFVAPNNAVIMAAAPRDRQATAAAMAATARNVGMASGVAMAVALHDVIGFRASLLAAASLAITAALVGLGARLVRQTSQS